MKIQLIDEVATDKADAIARCENFLGQFRKISPEARALTKQAFRNPGLMQLEENRTQVNKLIIEI